MIKLDVNELNTAASEFQKASEVTDALRDNLAEMIVKVSESIPEADEQIFNQYFQEWHTQSGLYARALFAISLELNAMAERYTAADTDI